MHIATYRSDFETRWQGIADYQQTPLVDSRRDMVKPSVSEGHPEVLCVYAVHKMPQLPAAVLAKILHAMIANECQYLNMEDIWTGRADKMDIVLPFPTKSTLRTSHDSSDDHSVTFPKVLHLRPDFFNDPDAFMAERTADLCGKNFTANDV